MSYGCILYFQQKQAATLWKVDGDDRFCDPSEGYTPSPASASALPASVAES
ncbi:MAG: hypothetical protein WD604_02265 [Balneolaceae bacterium]